MATAKRSPGPHDIQEGDVMAHTFAVGIVDVVVSFLKMHETPKDPQVRFEVIKHQSNYVLWNLHRKVPTAFQAVFGAEIVGSEEAKIAPGRLDVDTTVLVSDICTINVVSTYVAGETGETGTRAETRARISWNRKPPLTVRDMIMHTFQSWTRTEWDHLQLVLDQEQTTT